MRQIKFRGLRTDGRGWVYGDLVRDKHLNGVDTLFFILTEKAKTFDDVIPVIPESVGQFTGLHDKNGVEIYEGDRCKVTYYNHIEKNSEIIQDVVFVDGGFALLKVGNTTIENVIEDDRTFVPLYYSHRPNSIEIIGSIHTNEKGQEG